MCIHDINTKWSLYVRPEWYAISTYLVRSRLIVARSDLYDTTGSSTRNSYIRTQYTCAGWDLSDAALSS